MKNASNKKELSIISFESQKAFSLWLERNHQDDNGIWLKFFKKGSNIVSISYSEALDEALCYGWIDGQLKKYDEHTWLRKFTPRRSKSIWSKKNIEHAEQLVKAKKMKPSGLKQVETAKEDGRWQRGYDSPSKMVLPADFLKRLSGNKKAFSFYGTLNKSNKYAIAWRLQTAVSADAKEKRIKAILEMLEQGKKFHA